MHKEEDGRDDAACVGREDSRTDAVEIYLIEAGQIVDAHRHIMTGCDIDPRAREEVWHLIEGDVNRRARIVVGLRPEGRVFPSITPHEIEACGHEGIEGGHIIVDRGRGARDKILETAKGSAGLGLSPIESFIHPPTDAGQIDRLTRYRS